MNSGLLFKENNNSPKTRKSKHHTTHDYNKTKEVKRREKQIVSAYANPPIKQRHILKNLFTYKNIKL
jgi:hypothetical protein